MPRSPDRPIEATAPVRVDLAGGTLDIPPLGILVGGGLTVHAAIDRRCRIRLVPSDSDGHEIVQNGGPVPFDSPRAALFRAAVEHVAPPEPIRIEIDDAVPRGSGLGGSSTTLVALLAALGEAVGDPFGPDRLLRTAVDLEARLLGMPAGDQDHQAAIHGGVGACLYAIGRRGREPAPPGTDVWLSERMTVAWTGIAHDSGGLNWKLLQGGMTPAGKRAWGEIASVARDAWRAVLDRDLGGLAAAVGRDRDLRVGILPAYLPDTVRSHDGALSAVGVLGWRLCGAGGGGTLVALHPPEARPTVRAALVAAGMEPWEVAVDPAGVRIEQVGVSSGRSEG